MYYIRTSTNGACGNGELQGKIFSGDNEIWVLNENYIFSSKYDVILHREFKDLLITQNFTLYQTSIIDIIWIFMIQMWKIQKLNNDDPFLKYYAIITFQNWIKSLKFTQLSQYMR